MFIAIVAALAAGACFAIAGVLQQRIASTRPSRESMSGRLLLSLARQPVWLAGIGLAVLSYGFQSIALAYGPLSLVQPLIVSELIFAIPLSARLRHMRLRTREWLGAFAVAIGLAVAIASARPERGKPQATVGGWLVALSIVGVIALLALLGSRRAGSPLRASLIAFAAGIIMGVQAALLAATINRFHYGLGTVFAAWQTYLFVVASVGGVLLIQSAYQAGPLSASAPVIDASEPAVAITIGVMLFGEPIRTTPLAVGLTVLGLGLLLGGIVLLDTSPVMAALHAQERRDRPGDAGTPA